MWKVLDKIDFYDPVVHGLVKYIFFIIESSISGKDHWSFQPHSSQEPVTNVFTYLLFPIKSKLNMGFVSELLIPELDILGSLWKYESKSCHEIFIS